MIDLQHITQRYPTPEGGVFYALKDVSLHIEQGEIFGIIGRSGAGKSTLVRCINFLNRPSEGTVTVDGKCLNTMTEAELRASRRNIGMIFQHFNLLSSRTVFDNAAFPLELIGMDKAKIKAKVDPLLDLVGLSEHRNKYPAQLSGGQKQRVGIARALANDPRVLLSDEATSALDPETTIATLELLKRINKELGLTIVMITHQMDVVKQICDRVAVMNKGIVVEEGSVIDVFRRPQTETTKALIGNIMAQELPGSMLERVREQVAGLDKDSVHILRLSFVGSEVTRPVISEASRMFNIDVNILLGQVDEVHVIRLEEVHVARLARRARHLDEVLAVEFSVDAPVDRHHRSQTAAAEAGHRLKREASFRIRFAVLDPQFGRDPLLDQRGALDMACRSVAAADLEPARFDAFELGVECQHAFHFRRGHPEVFRNRADCVIGNVSLLLLNQLETFDQVAFLMPYLFQIGEL